VAGDSEWNPPGWPGPGTKMRFLDRNGYDYQLAEARELFDTKATYTVKNVEVGSWHHSFEFAEFPGQRFNGVMFEECEPPARKGPCTSAWEATRT